MTLSWVSPILLLAGLLLILIGRRERSRLPRGRMVYLDNVRLERAPAVLSDPETGLTGRPDYLIRTRRGAIPVEDKSATAPSHPYEGHVLQLAAYCRLVQATTGRRPSHGVIRYPNHSFRVEYSRNLEKALLRTLKDLGRIGDRAPDRSHQHHARCQACGYRTHCDQSLV